MHPATEYFWQGTRLGELRVLRCTACGQLVHPPRPACRRCLHDELVATALCGLGVVYSATTEHRLRHPLLGTPYRVGVVELDEAVRQLRGEAGDRQVAGAEVAVYSNAVGAFAGAMLLTR